MKKHKTTFITQTIIILSILINCSSSFGQDNKDNCELLTYKLYHKVKGEKIYVTGFDSSANYNPSNNELLLFIKNNITNQLDEKGNQIHGKVSRCCRIKAMNFA